MARISSWRLVKFRYDGSMSYEEWDRMVESRLRSIPGFYDYDIEDEDDVEDDEENDEDDD